MFAIFKAAGWPIWFLLTISIIATALIIERLLSLRRSRILPQNLLEDVIRVYKSGRINGDVITNLEQHSPLGKVLASGLRNIQAPREIMKESIEDAGRSTAHQLERYLNALGTIATLAPLLGLFGTIVGMIEIFGAQNASGTDPAQLARGISVALYNTGFGLAIAIPALAFYRYFRAHVDGLIIEMEQQAIRLINTVYSTHQN